jgi:hypothetical protein
MLTLIQAAWESACRLARCGRRIDALARIRKILALADVPADIAAGAHRLAGELLLDLERFRPARCQLRAALQLEEAARTHYLLGIAFEQDPHGDDQRAATRFRRAMRLEPLNALYRAAFGRAAVRCNRVKMGVKELLSAADAATDDIAVIRVVVEGLIEADQPSEAHRVLNKARFLFSKYTQFPVLMGRVRFEMARRGQRKLRSRQEASFAREGATGLLPFIRIANREEGGTPVGAGTIRCDTISFPRPHLTGFIRSKADR